MAPAVTEPAAARAVVATGMWTYSVSRERPARLALLAVGLGLAFVLAWLAFNALAGPGFDPGRIAQLRFWGTNGWFEAALRAVLLGYTLILTPLVLRSARRRIAQLRPILRGGPAAVEAAVVVVLAPPRLGRLVAGLVGAAVLLLLGFDIAIEGLGPFPPIAILWLSLFGWLIGRALFANLHVARSLSRLGERELAIDLLDLRPLAPLVQWGLRTVLCWTIWFALMALFWIGPGPKYWLNALGLLPLFAIAFGALFVPVRGVHRRIAEAKNRQLERLREEIRSALDAPSSADDPARLANLVAYQSLVERVREWPFDVSTLVRFGLYMTLGVGSWVGAALVEKLLGAALD
ncbi:MAG: hypothetical protein JSU66_14520 [Deltaproteobacteria bacterium]|nr:MAG: hypothetical protein JSU66_14520 [Deltaproteobacteria bacterium]